MTNDLENVDAFLAHYGVKGMKWGVHRQARLDRLQRVSSGTASTGDKLKTGMLDVAVGSKRSQISAQIRAAENLKGSIEKGEHVTGALLKYYGTRAVPQVAASTFNRAPKTRETMKANKTDSAKTKRVKDDFNNLSDREFFNKYATTKGVYSRRVRKSGGDPLKSNTAKLAKKLDESSFGTTAKRNVDRRNAKKYGPSN